MSRKAAVIGSGFAGLSAACHLARLGFDVTLTEKNSTTGGRARTFNAEGFLFDMGPSWYWMPDVFEAFFAHFGKSPADYYDLVRLSPSYRIFYEGNDQIDVPASLDGMYALFESLEPGSGARLQQFLKEAAYKYDVGINDIVYKPGLHLSEWMDKRLIAGMFKLHVFQSLRKHVRKFFKHPHLVRMLEFPVLFLGGTPANTPALYSLMNYADIALGTWYPMGGMGKIIDGMESLAISLGVNINTGEPVEEIMVKGRQVTGLRTPSRTLQADVYVSGADYHHTEQMLLPETHRRYSPEYWDKRVMAPSSLLFYLGVNKKVSGLLHHNLFFDEDFELHAKEIYSDPKWPTSPLFYVCCPSKTDPSVAPEGSENIFLLMPVAPGIDDSEAVREQYFHLIMDRLEKRTGEEIRSHIVYKRSYAHRDFQQDYNSFKGNAYGLANTLMQTAFFKPSIKSNQLDNLLYAGQLTVPGPGMPPALISGQMAATIADKQTRKL